MNVAVATRIRLLEEECAMSPAEAISRVNESVVVEMVVQGTKCCTGSRQVFLDSEPNHRDPKNLGDAGTGERLGLLATATVGEGGWVDLPEPIIVRAGETFIAVPESAPR